MSEIEARTLHQQEVMQAQVTRQREEIQSMERRLKDEFFSRIESIAEAIRLRYSAVESGVNECMHGASERFVPRVDGSLCSMKLSNAPLVAESPVGVHNTHSTQPSPP